MKRNKIEKYKRIADMGENAASNFVNYGVKKKSEGGLRAKKALLIFGYIMFVALFGALCFGVIFPVKVPMLFMFVIVFTAAIVFFTWRYVQIEYEYIILDGEFRMLEVYGSKSMRTLVSTRVSGMTAIAPYDHAHKAAADAVPPSNRIEAVSSMSAPDIYYAIFRDGDEDFVIFFEAIEKTLKVLRYYNENIVITKTRV